MKLLEDILELQLQRDKLFKQLFKTIKTENKNYLTTQFNNFIKKTIEIEKELSLTRIQIYNQFYISKE